MSTESGASEKITCPICGQRLGALEYLLHKDEQPSRLKQEAEISDLSESKLYKEVI